MKRASNTPDQLTIRVGHWLEAQATGRGVYVAAALVVVLVALGGLQAWWLS